MITTDRDVRDQVIQVIDQGEDISAGIDVAAITAEIVRIYGPVDIGTINDDWFWALVRSHDSTQQT